MRKTSTWTLVLILVACAGASLLALHLLGPETTGSARALPGFDSCEELAEAFRNVAGRYACDEEKALTMAPGAESSVSESLSPDHSTTNVQVEGVDEADTVKNDGEYIYAISGQSVFVLKAYPPHEAGVVSEIEFDGNQGLHELFITEDELVVIGSEYQEAEPADDPQVRSAYGLAFIEIYDISDRERPRVKRTIEYEGGYTTARMVEGNAYVVITTHPRFYDIEKVRGCDLVPMYRDTREGQEKGDLRRACDCEDVECIDPDGFSSFLSVLAIPIEGGDERVDRRVIAGCSESVYASRENLYVVSSDEYYWFHEGFQPEGRQAKTTIYKFKLDGPRTSYLTSAQVPGTVLNQFSMDEHEGYFRIATTTGHVSREGSGSTSNIYILDSDMGMVGKLEGLAPGERIYSARFMGHRAYLVTFKKVDPFFVIDVSDPCDPEVLGALKIPGYSDYLHPYDEDHIIGLGKNTVAADPSEGDFAWYQGIKIAIFDVSDFSNPREIHKEIIGDRGTDSYALHDHKAFLFDRERNLLVLPVRLAELTPEQKASPNARDNDCGELTFQGAYAYDVSAAGGFTLKGRITHMDDDNGWSGGYYQNYDSDEAVTRSLYMGDYLYTVSEARVKINRLTDVSEVGSVQLEGP